MHSPGLFPVILAAALAAGYLPSASGEEAGARADLMQPVPDIMSMPGLDVTDRPAPEGSAPYRAGVKAYLEGKDDSAIASLEEAVKLDAADEKSSRLLLKVLVRAINDNYARGDGRKARSLVRKAHDRFPSNPEVRLMYSSITEAGESPRRPPAPERPSAVRAPARRSEPAPAGVTRVSVPAPVPAASPSASAPDAWIYAGDGRITLSYPFAAAAAASLLALAAAFVYPRLRGREELLLRIRELRGSMEEEERKNAAVRKELEVWKGFGKQVEELELMRKTREQVMHLELEKMKAEEERKIMAELAERRREAERLAAMEISALAAGRVQAPAPAAAVSPSSGAPAAAREPSPPLPPAPRSEEAAPGTAAAREDKILEIMSDIAPPEREAAWERIAVQSASLYADFPEEAAAFFRTIAGDADPLNRASIAGALAGIASPETLDILLALYDDPSLEVRREVLKRLNMLDRAPVPGMDPLYRERIAACLNEEKRKGEWVF